MNKITPRPLPASIDATVALLAEAEYLTDRSLGTVLYLALKMGRPLFLEGEAGVGKTEIAKVLSQTLGRRLIRLQCYEGLDVAAAVYEWNYAAQMIAIRAAEAEGEHDRARIESDVFSERFLIKRPLLQALEPDTAGSPVLLIDELDRTDEAFEAFLLEVLSDFQVTIPEMGTVKAEHPPIVIITSNRTREVHDALKRRCLYHWVGYPSAARELEHCARQGAGHRQEAVRAGGGVRAGFAQAGIVQGAGRRGIARLGERAHRARRGGARSGDRLRYARRAAQIPGRHRAARRLEGQGDARRGEVGAARSGVIDEGAVRPAFSLPRLRGQGLGARSAPVRVSQGPGELAVRVGMREPRPLPSRLRRADLPASGGGEATGRLAENIVYFARALRAAGIPVGPGAVLDALEAVKAAGLGTREDFYWTLHAVFVKRHEHSIIFDQAFRIFFRRRGYVDQLMAMMLPQAPNAPRPPEAGATRVHDALFSGMEDKLKKEQEIELDTRMTVSEREVLQKKDFAQMTAAEIAAAKEAMKRLVLPLAEVRTRRLAPHPHGHVLDMRRTLRASMKGGGGFIDLRFIGPKTEAAADRGAARYLGLDEPIQPCLPAFPARAHRRAQAREHLPVRHAAVQRDARPARARSGRCARRLLGQRAGLVGRHAHRLVAACLQ